MSTCDVMNEHPANGHEPFARFVPMSCPRDSLHSTFPAAIPAHRQFLATRPLDDLLRCRQLAAFLSWPAIFRLSNTRRRRIQIGVRIETTDQRQALCKPVSEASQVVRAETAVSSKFEFSLGKPANQDCQQLPHQFGRSLVSPLVLFVPFLRMIQCH